MHSTNTKLIIIKSVHTIIWALFVSVIGYILWSGVSGKITRYTWWAVAAVILEGLTLAIFKGKCPLTVIARRYSKSERNNFDIYLPEWLAYYNKAIFTTLFGIGLVLIMLRSI